MRPIRPPASRPPRLRRRLLLILVAGLALAGFAWWRAGRHLERGREAFLAGRYDVSLAAYRTALRWRLRPAGARLGMGLAALGLGDAEAADEWLGLAYSSWLVPRQPAPAEVLDHFLLRGRAREAAVFGEHAVRVDESPEVHLATAAANLATLRLDRAEALLASLEALAAAPPQAGALREEIRHIRATGRRDFLFDASGRPLAAVRLDDGEAVVLEPELERLLGPAAGLLARLGATDRTSRVDLHLDLRLQGAARRALGSHGGALVALDPRSGGLLAVAGASAPGRPSAAVAGAVGLEAEYEPGSILKPFTAAAFLGAGGDLGAVLPLDCRGNQTIDGALYYDWTAHGEVTDLPQALAQSCNLAFARMGLAMGAGALDDALRGAGFGLPPLADEVSIRFGRFLPEDGSRASFALARRAVGLDSLTITPVHAALLAAALAVGGEAPRPRLIAGRQDPLGRRWGTAESAPLFRVELGGDALMRVRGGLERAVEGEHGTARRARIPGVRLALKTGTSGDRRHGLDAWIMGYAPAGEPRLAFAVLLEGGGKAEIAGAAAARAFLEAVPGLRPAAP